MGILIDYFFTGVKVDFIYKNLQLVIMHTEHSLKYYYNYRNLIQSVIQFF